MTFVVEIGSKQYLVEKGQKFIVDRLDAKEGSKIDLDLIYSFGEDAESSAVAAEVIMHQRGPKLRVTKYKPKSNYHRQYGPRQEETVLQITGTKINPKAQAKKETNSAKPASTITKKK